jgi:hypothetical protein
MSPSSRGISPAMTSASRAGSPSARTAFMERTATPS